MADPTILPQSPLPAPRQPQASATDTQRLIVICRALIQSLRILAQTEDERRIITTAEGHVDAIASRADTPAAHAA